MGDARQVNAHPLRMRRVQKGDKLVAYCWRGIDVNPTVQGRQCAILAGDGLYSRLLDIFATVAQHGIRSLHNVYAHTPSSELRSILGIAIRVPDVNASKWLK